RNTDKDLSASHTISIQFNYPQGFVHKGVAEVRGVLMRQPDQVRGQSLDGLSVKVTSRCDEAAQGKPGGCLALFLIALSSGDTTVQKNVQLLKERSSFDVALVYEDGRRAILAVEKGNPGDRAFAEAFQSWGQ